jgi:preprotein translocase subunit SecB
MSDPKPDSVNPQAGNLQGADAQQRSHVSIQKVYVKDLSLEIPHAPQIFAEQTQPQLEVQISTQAAKLSDTHYEVGVSATVTAKVGERTLFLAEVLQAGIFLLSNIPPSDLEPVLAISCPTILYPYLREAVSDVVSRGGFPPVLLGPMAFETLYLQRLQEQQQQQQPTAPQQELSR